MRVIIKDNFEDLSTFTANYIAKKINNVAEGSFLNVIFPVGNSNSKTYEILIDMVKSKQLSFKSVRIFQMDEFVGLEKDSNFAQRNQLYEHLLKHIDINPKNVHLFDAWVPAAELDEECENFERKIEECGGIDFAFFGTGADGHLARNEPGSSIQSKSGKTFLAFDTRLQLAQRWEMVIDEIPQWTVTAGINTLYRAKDLLVIFSGVSRAHALERVLENSINHMFPVSAFQTHGSCIFVCDEDATNELRVKTVHYFKSIAETAKLCWEKELVEKRV